MARQQAPLIAVILGVALTVALRYGQGVLNDHYSSANGVTPNWFLFAVGTAQTLVVLVPGFVAGWVASRRELLCGFLTGLLGTALFTAIFSLGNIWRSAPLGFLMFLLLSAGISGGLFAAAAAGTAGLLRSNNRWRGP